MSRSKVRWKLRITSDLIRPVSELIKICYSNVRIKTCFFFFLFPDLPQQDVCQKEEVLSEEEPEVPHVKEEPGEPEPPHVKEEPEELESQPIKEEPELPGVKEEPEADFIRQDEEQPVNGTLLSEASYRFCCSGSILQHLEVLSGVCVLTCRVLNC